jgi:hypothetical protein
MAPRKPKSAPPIDLDDIIARSGGATTTIPPNTTIPTTPTSTSTNTNRGRTLSPDVQAAENKLRYTAQGAANLGIDTSEYYKTPKVVPANFVSTGNAQVDQILLDAQANAEANKPKDDDDGGGGFWGGLGNAVLGGLGDVVNIVDIPRRVVISTVKEIKDLVPGGDKASFGDWFSQVSDKNLSSRIIIPQTGIGWLDATAGFIGDVALDPTTYLTLGGSAIAKTSVNVGTKLAVKEVAEASAEKLLKAGIDKAALETAQKTADDLIKVAKDLSDELTVRGIGSSDDVIKAQQRAVIASQQAKDLTLDAAKALDGKGGKILKAEDARKVAYEKWAGTTKGSVGYKAAQKELDAATSYLARQSLIRGGVRRQYRATAREILGENATHVRNLADDLIKAADAKVSSGFALSAAEDAALDAAKRTVTDLSDEMIAKIYKNGYGALRGTGADAGRALGTRTGSRIGIGKASAYIGSGKFTGVGGKALTGLRSKAFAKAPGILDWITPLGRKGIFGDADLLKMRRVLQTGVENGVKVAPDVVKTYGTAIALNRAEEIVRKQTLTGVAKLAKQAVVDIDKDEAPAIIKFLEDGIVIPDAALQAKATRVREFLDTTYNDYASKVASMGDVAKQGMPNYFPHVMSQDAMEWASKNPSKIESIAQGVGLDKQRFVDNFIERELTPGKVWFGHVLTPDDLKGGIARLNDLARAGGFKGNFFETDLNKALLKYSQKHAANLSFLETIDKFSGSSADDILAALKNASPSEGFLDDITKVFPESQNKSNLIQRRAKGVQSLTPEEFQDLEDSVNGLYGVITLNYTPLKLRQWSKSAAYEVEQRLIRIQAMLDDVLTQGDVGVGAKLKKEVDDLTNFVIKNNNNKNAIPSAQKLTLDEIDQTVERVVLTGTDPAQLQAAIDNGISLRELGPNGDRLYGYSVDNLMSYFGKSKPDQWKSITRTLSDGFEELGMRDIPDIAARKEVAQMFNRLQNMTDQKFAAGLDRLVGDFNTFFKSWATTTVGFHFRNALSNTFQLVAEGASPKSMSEGVFYYNRYLLDTTERAAKKLGFLTPDEWVQTLKVSGKKKQTISEALLLTGADGQMSEVFDDAVRIGISGKGVADDATLKSIRGLLGRPLKGSRAVGEYVEGITRFISNYDGLMKGLDTEEALARTNKYLFDYQNLSSLDKIAKQVVPFWIWTSRNFPLYMENLVTNPRAYAQYGAFKRAVGSDTGLPYMSQRDEEMGGFGLNQGLTDALNSNPITQALTGGNTENKFFRPDLGFPGAGRPSQLDLLTRAVPALLSGNTDELLRATRETLGSTTPLLQIPIELATGTSLYKDQPIANKYLPIDKGQQRVLDTVGKFLPAYQWLGRTANTAIGAGDLISGGENKVLRDILGVIAPDTQRQRIIAGVPQPYTPEGMSQEELDDRLLQSAAGSIGAFIGSPVRGLTEGQQIAEINRRIRALEELIRLEKLKNQ